jgi:DNA invertase Pin-like site-specific DNA recombinase
MLLMAAETERDLIRERTLDGLPAAEAQGRRGGHPAIARHLSTGRSTLYRALQPCEDGDGGISVWQFLRDYQDSHRRAVRNRRARAGLGR